VHECDVVTVEGEIMHEPKASALLVWFPDPSLKLRTDPRGRVWANDLPFGVAEH